MLRRGSTLLALAAAAAAAVPVPALAQRPPVAITGTVKDPQGNPIERAEVMVSGTDLRATTSPSGAFRLDSVPPGRRWVAVRRLGFEPVAYALTIEKGKSRELTVEMDPLPQSLPEKVVRARSGYAGRYADFYRRSRSAFGNFITHDDIARERPSRLGWMVLRYLPFIDSRSMDEPAFAGPAYGAFAASAVPAAGSVRAGRSCPPAVSLNGAPPTGGWAVNDFAPDEVEAVEVYRPGRNRLPMEFSDFRTAACGLVVVWLR